MSLRSVTHRVLWLLPILLGALVWLPTLNAGWVADDFMILRHIQNGGAFGLWSSPGQGWFRPLVSVSFWIDWNLWGSNAWGWHLHNLLLHLANSLLVGFSLMQWLQLFPKACGQIDKTRVGIFAATLFAVLPVHGETVAWISDRTDVLSVFFALCSWNAYLFARRKGSVPWLAWLFFAIALCGKEAVLTLPGAIFLVEWAIQGRPRLSKAWLKFLPWLLIGICYIPLRAHFVGALVGGYGASAHFGTSPFRLMLKLFLSLGRMLMPDPMPLLDAFHLVNPVIWRWSLYGVYSLVGILITLYAILQLRGKCALSHVAWLGATVAWLLPSLNLGFQVDCSISVRFLYFASAALVPWFVIQLENVGVHRGSMRIGALTLLMIGCVSAWETANRWKDAGALAENVLQKIEKAPQAYRKHLVVGIPDHLKGALVFRSGLDQALKMRGLSESDSFTIPAVMTYWSKQDSMQGKTQGDMLWVMSSNPFGRWVLSPDTCSCWSLDETQRVLKIRQDSLCPTAKIMNFADEEPSHKAW